MQGVVSTLIYQQGKKDMSRLMGRCINGGVIVAATIGWFCGVPLSGLAAPVGLGAVIGSAAGVAMVNKQQNYYEASEVFGRVI